MMPSRTRQRWSLALALVVLGAGLWAFYHLAAFTSRAGAEAPLYATQRFDPYGTAALKQLLQTRGHTVQTLQNPRMLRRAKGVLVQVLPTPDHSISLFGRGDRPDVPADRLKQWIAEGNTVVQLTRAHTPLMQALGLRVSGGYYQSRIEEEQRQGRPPNKLTALRLYRWQPEEQGNAPNKQTRLALRAPRDYSPSQFNQSHITPLARSAQGVVAAEVTHGQGKLIAIAAPTPALNHTLKDGDNLELVLSLLERGDQSQPIWFDAWSLGLGHPGTVMGLIRRFNLLPALLQVVLVIVVYHWAGRGRAAVAPPPVKRRRSSTEQLHTLGYLYQRSMASEELARRTYDMVLRRIGAAFGWPTASVEARLGLAGGSKQRAASAAQTPTDPAEDEARQLVQAARDFVCRFPVRCRKCRYNLGARETAECPECGQPTTYQQRHHLAAVPADGQPAEQPMPPKAAEKEAIRLLEATHDLTQRLGAAPHRPHAPGPRPSSTPTAAGIQ